MSIHVEISEDAQNQLTRQRRWSAITAWLISLLSLILLAVILMALKIYLEEKPVGITIVPVDRPVDIIKEPKPLTPEPPESPVPWSPIKTPMENNNHVNLPPGPKDFLNSPDLNFADREGHRLGVISNGPPGDLTPDTLFGDEESDGSTLEGLFVDTKLDRFGKETKLSEAEFLKVVNEFISKGWNDSQFNRFYKSPVKLYIPFFYISKSNADDAPKAFKCPEKVKGSRWVAVYRGKVEAPKSGKFRFVGYGDDALVVRFNQKNVFDYGWYQIGAQANTATSNWQSFLKTGDGSRELKKKLADGGINKAPMTFFKYASTPHWNGSIGGMAAGQEFTVKKGEVYPIEVLVSEIPGGAFGMCLLIEEIGDKDVVKEPGTGTPILNLFRTDLRYPGAEVKKDNPVPYREDSYVWKVVK